MATNNSSIPTTSSSSLNSNYSPISTLERQYAGPLGQRLILGVQANAACCLEGGVESILKQLRQQGGGSGGGSAMLSSETMTGATFDESKDDDFDAFGFLQEDNNNNNNNNGAANTNTSTTTSSTANTKTNSARGGSSSIGGFLKKVAASTSATLERQMQSMAVRIDKGRNSDLLRVAFYDPHTEELLGVTEALPLPTSSSSSSDGGGGGRSRTRQDVRFRVPLVVSGRRRQQTQFRLKLWIQSGAAILQSTKALAKYYLLGQATIDATTLSLGTVTAIPLSSNLVVGGQLHICALPDAKFSQVLQQRSWSLTDPDMSAYSSDLCNLPLDQSYIFNGKPEHPHHWLVATERATESTIPLPIAAACMEWAAKATQKSLYHAQSVAKVLRQNRHDFKDDTSKATCLVGLTGIQTSPTAGSFGGGGGGTASLSVAWRRPDSIFELELVSNQPIPIIVGSGGQPVPSSNNPPPVQIKLYPKVCTEGVLPGILQAFGGQMPASGFLLGALYFCVTLNGSSSSSSGGGGHGSDNQVQVWETVVGMEGFIDTAGSAGANNNANMVQLPLLQNGQPMGLLLAQIKVTMPTQRDSNKPYPATDGLVSLVGLDPLAYDGNPGMDHDPTPILAHHQQTHESASASALRKQQLDTMGLFFTTQYMEQHLALRQSAMEGFQERARLYKQALVQPERSSLSTSSSSTSQQQQHPQPHETKTPKAFRPSSSRMETTLSALPFNCHVVQMNINVVDALRAPAPSPTGQQQQQQQLEYPGACFTNITHGAPSDHARGFGNILAGMNTAASAAGGLRRLEAKRYELALALNQAQNQLIAGVGHFLATARQSGATVHHIPSRHADLQRLRWRVFEATHNLHHVSWMCAVRRANVFSQSLGLAITSYLASISSDQSKIAAGWPDIWRRHGYMVCFEGLLSAAGKELGMIEDASVAISMLRMVRVVLMPDNGIPSKAVFIPSSPYMKWVNLFPSGQGPNRHFLLQIGVDPSYYHERIPPPLRNGTAVQLYPVLYQVGVDIRQWGANTGNNIMSKNGTKQEISTGGLVDDEDDDVGIVDSDVLVALNYEAFQKMNAYAHAIRPQEITLDKIQAAMIQVFRTNPQNMGPEEHQVLPIHPTMALLHQHIKSSAGRMNHSILDEAAMLAQQLGGGGLVFCKSGKDRTAMHVTYKQAQFAAQYRGVTATETILDDATLIRIYGTRLPICEKNVGQAKYAFNSLQVQFMPDALKPPMNTLAGFLKGGRLFSGEGAIET